MTTQPKPNNTKLLILAVVAALGLGGGGGAVLSGAPALRERLATVEAEVKNLAAAVDRLREGQQEILRRLPAK